MKLLKVLLLSALLLLMLPFWIAVIWVFAPLLLAVGIASYVVYKDTK